MPGTRLAGIVAGEAFCIKRAGRANPLKRHTLLALSLLGGPLRLLDQCLTLLT